MTTHDNAVMAAVLWWFFICIGLIGNDSTNPWAYINGLLLVPLLVYAIARIIQIVFRLRIIVMPYMRFIPRCHICEAAHRPYVVTRTVAVINEWWNISHEHRSTILKSRTLTCDAGHFIEFMKTEETKKSRFRKNAVQRMAEKVQVMRKERELFHATYVAPNLDTQS